MNRRNYIRQFHFSRFSISIYEYYIIIIASAIILFAILEYLYNLGILSLMILILLIRRSGAGMVSQYSLWKNMKKKRLLPRSLDVINYIENKTNGNVLICGTSGQGKSKLMRYLLYSSDDLKYIFSYKSNDEYLKMGYKIINIKNNLINPFNDVDSFVSSFLITFSMDNLGITAQYIPSLLMEIAKLSGDWISFSNEIESRLKRSRDSIQRSALLFIKESIKSLYNGNYKGFELKDESMVFDFSSLNLNAQIFYTELLLRMIWNDLSNNRKKCIICIDEAHRMLKSFGRYHSIYVEIAREIRAFGKLWTSTQNYSDLDDSIRNQFATQFIFNTVNENDLRALEKIDEKLRYAAYTMPRHVFTDARYEWIYKTVPEFTLYWFPVNYNNLNDDKSDNKINIIRSLKEKPGTIDDIRNSMASDIIELKNDNIIRSIDMDGEIYFLNRKGISDLHRYMQDIVIKMLLNKGYSVSEARPGEDKPDIMTETFNIEIETGFKHDKSDLIRRIKNSNKKTYVIVPNNDVKSRYNDMYVFTIKEFKDLLNKIKN